ncbi:hypothetical protein [Moritella dasanensis]|uniref:hypothetical protein n=1 Tax=Moritella dasanensis TaxID=428031 RepID=UPI0002EA5F5B|nr:hypothetical protein [Moritella dasanensis]
MIVFTIASVSSLCGLLKNIPKNKITDVFFDDGTQHHKVTGLTPVEQYFDVNGMYQTHTIGYTIDLINGDTIRLDINGELLRR